jgi:hypothetical protein
MTWPVDELTARAALRFDCGVWAYEVLDLPDELLRRLLAVHEAGHAVLGIGSGCRIGYVRIGADLGRGRATDPLIPDYGAAAIKIEPSTVYSEDWVVSLAAGSAAQVLWLDDQGLLTDARAAAVVILSEHDRRDAQAALQPLGVEIAFTGPAKPGTGWWWWYYGQAGQRLRDRWETVLAVAEALDAAGHLDGPAVHSLVETLVHEPQAGSELRDVPLP